MQYAASGAGTLFLAGCAGPMRRASIKASRAAERNFEPKLRLVDRDKFRRLADVALNETGGDHILVSLRQRDGWLTQFENDQVRDYPDSPQREFFVQVAFGRKSGTATTSDLTEAGVIAAVKSAEQTAQAAADDPNYLPPLPRQRPPILPTYRLETALADRARRAAAAREIAEMYESRGLGVAVIVATSGEAVGVAADTGLFEFEQRTLAEFDVRSTGSGIPIRAANAHRSIDDLRIGEHVRAAVARAKWLSQRRRLSGGIHAVILAPTATAQLLRPLLDATDARGCHDGAGVLRDKLGKVVIDTRLTLGNRPDHPDLLGGGFNEYGLPADARPWIEDGVLKRLHYDRLAAREHETSPTYAPDAWHLAGPAGVSPDDLMSAAGRGVLITGFEEPRRIDPLSLTVDGRTSSETYLFENGAIVGSLGSLPWRENSLSVFNRVDSYTNALGALVAPTAAGAVTEGVRKLLVPAMLIRESGFEG